MQHQKSTRVPEPQDTSSHEVTPDVVPGASRTVLGLRLLRLDSSLWAQLRRRAKRNNLGVLSFVSPITQWFVDFPAVAPCVCCGQNFGKEDAAQAFMLVFALKELQCIAFGICDECCIKSDAELFALAHRRFCSIWPGARMIDANDRGRA